MIWRNFCEKIVAVKFHKFQSVRHAQCHTFFWPKIPWKQRRFTKELIWRNIFNVRVNLSFFQTEISKCEKFVNSHNFHILQYYTVKCFHDFFFKKKNSYSRLHIVQISDFYSFMILQRGSLWTKQFQVLSSSDIYPEHSKMKISGFF